MWNLYHHLDIMGEIFYINGNDNIFITSPEHIYIYQIDSETLSPVLQNVVSNYMQCSSVLVSSLGLRYFVAYKRHETSFMIYKKKFFHSFRTPICNEELEYAQGLDLSRHKIFAIANLS